MPDGRWRAQVLSAARRMGLEGIVSKQATSPYRSGRQDFWIKTKCKRSDTFPIIGYVKEQGAKPRRGGALYVGRREGDSVVYAGKIAIGLPLKQAAELLAELPEGAAGRHSSQGLASSKAERRAAY